MPADLALVVADLSGALGATVLAVVAVALACVYVQAWLSHPAEHGFAPSRRIDHEFRVDAPQMQSYVDSVASRIGSIEWYRSEVMAGGLYGIVRPRIGRMDDLGGGVVRVSVRPHGAGSLLQIESRSHIGNGGFGRQLSRELRHALGALGVHEHHDWSHPRP